MVDPRYPEDWPEIARIVKENAHWRCQNCGHHHEPRTGYTLTVHHIDLNPANCARWNLVALCQKCHLHFQRPLNTLQSSFLPLPEWLHRYLDAIQSKSDGFLDPTHTKLPVRPHSGSS